LAALYEARNLTKSYDGRTVLDVRYLCLDEGGCSALIGPNGSGKSTLLELLAGLTAPTTGATVYRGRKMSGADSLAGEVTLALQHPYMFRGTVRDNVEYGLRVRRLPRSEMNGRVERCLAAFGLLDLADRGARGLSGGETQLVSLARALAPETRVVLLDEPLSYVDANHQELITAAIREIRADGRTVVVAAHDLNGLRPVVDRVIPIEGGRCRTASLNSMKPNEGCSIYDLA